MSMVIALTQFVFLALSNIAVIVLEKAQGYGQHHGDSLSAFLIHNSIWLLLLPFLWWALAEGTLKQNNSPATRSAVHGSGIIIAIGIVVLYGWVILRY